MDTKLITAYGMDVDQLFVSGAGNQEFGIFTAAGVDVGYAYLKGNAGYKTGFQVKQDSTYKDIGSLLADNAILCMRSGQHTVGGQGRVDSANNAGFAYLDDFDINREHFVDLPPTEERGGGQSYGLTQWYAFTIQVEFDIPNIDIQVRFTPHNNNAGWSISKIREHSRRHKDFVISGWGGDGGHYGACDVWIDVKVPGIRSFSYHGYFWNRTN